MHTTQTGNVSNAVLYLSGVPKVGESWFVKKIAVTIYCTQTLVGISAFPLNFNTYIRETDAQAEQVGLWGIWWEEWSRCEGTWVERMA